MVLGGTQAQDAERACLGSGSTVEVLRWWLDCVPRIDTVAACL